MIIMNYFDASIVKIIMIIVLILTNIDMLLNDDAINIDVNTTKTNKENFDNNDNSYVDYVNDNNITTFN